MENKRTFSQENSCENQLNDAQNNPVAQFWQSRQEGHFIGQAGLRLYWCQFTAPEHNKAIIVVNGRTDACIKYQAVFFDLFQQGYDVYSYDHRGQGQSQRLILSSDIGHVVEFKDYVDDLNTFLTQHLVDQEQQKKYQKRFIYSESEPCSLAHFCNARKKSASDTNVGVYLHQKSLFRNK